MDQSTASPRPPQDHSAEVTLALAGDIMLGRLVSTALRFRGASYVWGDTTRLLSAADLTIVNLECVIARAGVGREWARWPKAFHFKSEPPQAIQALKLAGVDCVCLANNHVLDYEEEAFLEMLGLLEEAGIPYSGAGRNADAAHCPVLLDAGALKVGVVAFTDNEPGWAAGTDTPGTNWIPVSLQERSLAPVRESIARARAGGAALVVFSIHWGPNMVQRPTPLFREFAHAVVEAGADVFFGHSAHVFQGIEIYRGHPIIYDAGDFVDDYAIDPLLRNDRGLLFLLTVQAQGSERSESARVRRVDMVPVMIDNCQVRLAHGSEWAAITEQMRKLSAELGTTTSQDPDWLRIDSPS